MQDKLKFTLLGAVIGAVLMVALSLVGLIGFADKAQYSVAMEISKEKAEKLAGAIERFDGEKVLISDDAELYIQCPGSAEDSCDLRFDRNQ